MTGVPPYLVVFERNIQRLFLIIMVTLIDGRYRQFQIPPTQTILHPISRHDFSLFKTLSIPWCRKVFQNDLRSARPTICKTCRLQDRRSA